MKKSISIYILMICTSLTSCITTTKEADEKLKVLLTF